MAKNKERIFRMKQFSVRHERSANKVGVDGVLIGAWADMPESLQNPPVILDAGCGCGLIALMMAQRFPDAIIYGIDIEPEAIAEASLNASVSPWADRITIEKADFSNLSSAIEAQISSLRFDLIVSNPPFFHSGADASESARMTARHADTLSPESLILLSQALLADGGELAFIAEFKDLHRLADLAENSGLTLTRHCIVRGNPRVEPKRVMMQFRLSASSTCVNRWNTSEELIIEHSVGEYTESYLTLCRDFYLKF